MDVNEIENVIKNEKLLNSIDENSLNLRDFGDLTIWFAKTKDIKGFVYNLLEFGDMQAVFEYYNNGFLKVFDFDLEEYVKIFKNVFDNDFYKLNITAQKVILVLFFYTHIVNTHVSSQYIYFFKVLYNIFARAKSLNNIELMAYLYIPLLFSFSNDINNNHKRQKDFNKKVNKVIEKAVLKNFKSEFKSEKKHEDKIKIGFMIERAVWHSVNQVNYGFLLNLKNTLEQTDKNIEVVILNLQYFEFLGGDSRVEEKFKSLGFEYINLHSALNIPSIPIYDIVDKSIKARDFIRDLNLDVLIMSPISHFTHIFLLNSRVAKKQIYWSHINCAVDVKGIDKRVSHFEQSCKEFDWEIIRFQMPQEILVGTEEDKQKGEKLKKEMLEKYGKDTIILGTMGRLIKIDNDEYLQTVAQIMKENPNTIYLACGSGDTKPIKEKLRKYGIDENRFIFTGHINPHVYGWVIDIMLDTFPERQGQSMAEFTAKGGECVVLDRRLKKKGIDPILEYINSATKKITWIRVRRKYKKVEFTKEDFWNFSLLKDHSELFLSYDKIMEEKNVELLREILERFESIKILVDEKDYDKLAPEQEYKERLIIENDIFERAYRSDFFMLFENKQEIFKFVRDYTTARIYIPSLINEIPWKVFKNQYENNVNNFKDMLHKIFLNTPDKFYDFMYGIYRDCFESDTDFINSVYFNKVGHEFILEMICWEVQSNKLLSRIRLMSRLNRFKEVIEYKNIPVKHEKLKINNFFHVLEGL